MAGFDILVLDKNFELITVLNYTILQWTRKYFEAGTFSIQIPMETYSSEFKYIYTNERPELGVIEQTNIYIDDAYRAVNLSGYFLENELHKRIAYSDGNITNVVNRPTWSMQSGKAEDVAFQFFNAFKDVSYTIDGATHTAVLGIESGTSLHRGHHSENTRGNEYLSNKIYSILKPSKMSYRVEYDFNTSRKVFNVWKGIDRTEKNAELNNPVIFSTKYGNITNADLLIDSVEYANAYIINSASATEQDGNKYLIIGENSAEGDDDIRFYQNQLFESSSDYATQAEYLEAINAQGRGELLKHQRTISLDFDTITGGYEYMEDFDLGDECTIVIPELDLSVNAVLSAIYEVVKQGVWTMTLGFTTY